MRTEETVDQEIARIWKLGSTLYELRQENDIPTIVYFLAEKAETLSEGDDTPLGIFAEDLKQAVEDYCDRIDVGGDGEH